MISHTECLVCGSDQNYQYHECTDHFLSKEVFTLRKCKDCGFIFTGNHPSKDESGRYYDSSEYISHNDSAGGIVNRLYRMARKLMLSRKRKLVKKITGKSSGSILDIGSGTGHFLAAMKEAGWKVDGIEPGDLAREYSVKLLGLEIGKDTGSLGGISQSYDCITMWHVLEHFHDPAAELDQVRRLLKTSGRCIVALPNSNSYDSAHYKEYWAAWDVPRHLWHFDRETFIRFAGKSGFKTEKVIILPLDVFYISILSEKYMGSKLPFLRGLTKAFWFSLKTLFNRKNASSVIYILHP